MSRRNERARNALLALLAFSCVMAALQWLVGPVRGARDIALQLRYDGRTAAGTPLLKLANSHVLRTVDEWWQLRLNYPRNWLYTRVGLFSFPDQADLFSWTHQVHPWHDVWYSAMLIAGTMLTYGPLLVVIFRHYGRSTSAAND